MDNEEQMLGYLQGIEQTLSRLWIHECVWLEYGSEVWEYVDMRVAPQPFKREP